MKYIIKIQVLCLLLFVANGLFAAEMQISIPVDSTAVSQQKSLQQTPPSDSISKKFKPDPVKAIWYAAVVPGLGQVYNQKYWKLPLLYGGGLGLAYAITWNNRMYIDYQKAYRDIIDDDPTTQSYLNILPSSAAVSADTKSYYTSLLKSKQDNYRRNRDLSIICTIGLYLVSVVDAYVDAQMYDFDISPNLSMKLSPNVSSLHKNEEMSVVSSPISPDLLPSYIKEISSDYAFGIKCKICFKKSPNKEFTIK